MSAKQMAWFCHTLGTMLDAGLPTTRALDVLASQAPSGRMRSAMVRARKRIDRGDTLAEALEAQRCFPRLLLQLVRVGEESGTLDRTMQEAASFYELQQRLWRTFLSRITLPVIQYVVAVAVVTFATYLVNSLLDRPAHILPGLLLGYGLPVLLVLVYQLLVKPFGGARTVHEVLLRTPILGRVAQSLALSRFSLVMYLMLEAGVPAIQAVTRAFESTGNRAFAARGLRAARAIEDGGNLTEALVSTGLFTREYRDIVQVAEESGKLSERFEWCANEYSNRAEFALGMLAGFMARLIWVIVALFILVFIFKFFGFYSRALSGAGL